MYQYHIYKVFIVTALEKLAKSIEDKHVIVIGCILVALF